MEKDTLWQIYSSFFVKRAISIACPDSSITYDIFVFRLLNDCQVAHVNCLLLYQKISLYSCPGYFQKLVFSLNVLMGLLGFLQLLISVVHAGLFDQFLDSDAWSWKFLGLFVCFGLNKINFYDFLALRFSFNADFSKFFDCVLHRMGFFGFWS